MNTAEIGAEKTIERRNKIVSENLGLVHLCANRFRGRGAEYEELYSAGCMGLVKAATGFDENRGVMFSTYAVPVIMGEIKRIFRDGGTVKVSRSIKELSIRIAKARQAFSGEYGREPLLSELAELTDSSTEAVAEAIAASKPCISLTRGDENDGEEADIPSPFSESDMCEPIALHQVMDTLSASDRRLIYLRYFKSLTQNETAGLLGMTQVQVARREKKILEEMKRQLTIAD